MTVVDTTWLVDAMRGDAMAVGVLGAHEAEGWTLRASIPSLHELFAGLARPARPARELEKVRGILEHMEVLPFGRPEARLAGDLEGGLHRAGVPIGPLDCMIAACALRHDSAIVTRNIRHFDRITGLHVQTY